MLWGFSALKEEYIKAINELETEMGITLLAFSGISIRNAELTKEDLQKIQELEKKLGLSLVAVNVE